jgi:hypothetical protein
VIASRSFIRAAIEILLLVKARSQPRAIEDDRTGHAEIILWDERWCRPSSSLGASMTSPLLWSDVEVLEEFK